MKVHGLMETTLILIYRVHEMMTKFSIHNVSQYNLVPAQFKSRVPKNHKQLNRQIEMVWLRWIDLTSVFYAHIC